MAVRLLLRDAGVTPRSELINATARLFGWSRTGPDTKSRMDAVIGRLLAENAVTEFDGQLSLIEWHSATTERNCSIPQACSQSDHSHTLATKSRRVGTFSRYHLQIASNCQPLMRGAGSRLSKSCWNSPRWGV